jgi:DNA-binding PadR family transcriptional regulator
MDKHKFLLLEALRHGAGQPEGVRLYRSGKLAGLFAGRTREHAAVADQAVRDGLLEIARVETRGKTTVEWVRVTPKGIEYLLQHEAPTRALEDLRETIDAHRRGVPIWVAELREGIEMLQRRLANEVEAIGARLDRLSERALEAIQRLEQAHGSDPPSLPWAPPALSYLQEREEAGLGARCPLAELFAALKERQVELSLKDFHLGLRRLHERSLVQLLPDDGQGQPPAPEYGLIDANAVYHHVTRVVAASR